MKNTVKQFKTFLDNKRGNKAADKLYKIIHNMKQDIYLAENMLDILIESNEPNVKIWACSVAFDIDYKFKEAEKILEHITNSSDLGILSLSAEMVLENHKGKTT